MCSQMQDRASEVLLPVMNHPSASVCMKAAPPVASGQVGQHLSYLPPGPTGPLCSPLFAEALPSPGFLTSPTSLFQFLAGRSPTGESSTSSSSQPVNSDVAAALLSLKRPVVHQQPLGLSLQTQLSPIPEGEASKNDKTGNLSSQGLLEDSGLDLNSSGGSPGMSSPESVSCKTDLSPMLFAQATPCHPYWPYHSHGYSAACFQPVAGFACVRGRMRPNSCHICGKSYARASTLRTHMRTHNGEKPYQCSLCFKSFTQAANLTAHMRTHSGEKPFKCPMCDRRFSQSSSVTTHMRTHSGERPYKCTMCSKAFADSSTLTKHFRTHSGEKPYQCHICDAMFSQSGNLNRHMKTHKNVHF